MRGLELTTFSWAALLREDDEGEEGRRGGVGEEVQVRGGERRERERGTEKTGRTGRTVGREERERKAFYLFAAVNLKSRTSNLYFSGVQLGPVQDREEGRSPLGSERGDL